VKALAIAGRCFGVPQHDTVREDASRLDSATRRDDRDFRTFLERLNEVQRPWLKLALMRVVPGDQRLELL
jgi:hypothetical protein